MGQAIATRLLGREAGGDEDSGGCLRLFAQLCCKMWEAIISFLRRLLQGKGKGPVCPPSNPTVTSASHHSFIDIGVDLQASNYPSVANTASVVSDGGESGTPIPPVHFAITLEDAHPCSGAGKEDSILKSLQPVTPTPSRRDQARGRLGPYSWEQKILLVGEGDFSFSASLGVAFGDASNIISTSLDSLEFLMRNYKRAISNINELTSRSCKVIHGVDATRMATHPQLRSLKFDCIVYNFPHAGFANRHGPRGAQIRTHQALVKGFLVNAKKMIKSDGQIHITHKCHGFFLEWNLETLGSNEGLRLVEETPFNIRDYPGYETKFGYGGDRNFNCDPCRRYIFQLPS